jgi:hypothetical protein
MGLSSRAKGLRTTLARTDIDLCAIRTILDLQFVSLMTH